jgi:hypothetical protein
MKVNDLRFMPSQVVFLLIPQLKLAIILAMVGSEQRHGE